MICTPKVRHYNLLQGVSFIPHLQNLPVRVSQLAFELVDLEIGDDIVFKCAAGIGDVIKRVAVYACVRLRDRFQRYRLRSAAVRPETHEVPLIDVFAGVFVGLEHLMNVSGQLQVSGALLHKLLWQRIEQRQPGKWMILRD